MQQLSILQRAINNWYYVGDSSSFCYCYLSRYHHCSYNSCSTTQFPGLSQALSSKEFENIAHSFWMDPLGPFRMHIIWFRGSLHQLLSAVKAAFHIQNLEDGFLTLRTCLTTENLSHNAQHSWPSSVANLSFICRINTVVCTALLVRPVHFQFQQIEKTAYIHMRAARI